MNKAELVAALAATSDVSKKDCEAVLNAFTQTVKEKLASGGEVALVGFGTFKVDRRSARTGRNPQTGEPIEVTAKNVVKFKAGSAFTDALNT